MIDGSEIGRRISLLRQRRGITLPDLATDANVSKGYLWALETHWQRRPSDSPPNPGLDVLAKLASKLGITVAELVAVDFNLENEQLPASRGLPPGLAEFLRQRADNGNPVPDDVVPALVEMKLRGRRPQTIEEWTALYDAIEGVIAPDEKAR